MMITGAEAQLGIEAQIGIQKYEKRNSTPQTQEDRPVLAPSTILLFFSSVNMHFSYIS
jgi:hypothetical protein